MVKERLRRSGRHRYPTGVVFGHGLLVPGVGGDAPSDVFFEVPWPFGAVEKNDRMSRKRRARERNILVGDHVLVRNRRSGSKFLLPFEKDPWVTCRMASGEMETDQFVPPDSLNEDDNYRSVDSRDRRTPLPNSGMVVGESLPAGRECADGLSKILSRVLLSLEQLARYLLGRGWSTTIYVLVQQDQLV
ncbi:hypothetical protein NDU88_007711 [Pleurodeles waltl]|uniref:Uncharacterized protein n=1 Tax=Pleurodeles waltl TaxID=8319 RepID=A0AAV7VQI1_PLEWA|nr:hypothetical protein NDU88_007711 [Pleurodeles waltl]